MNELRLEANGAGAFAVSAAMASEPAWTLDLGPTGLTVSDVRVVATRPPRSAAGQAAAGSFSGLVALGDELELGVAYQTPGSFVMRADLPDVRLMELVRALTSLPLALPGDFDLAFTDSSVLIQDAGQGLVFQLATTMDDLGTVAVEVRRASGGGGWGFAAGVDLASPRLSALPGLGVLAPFEDFFRMDELLLVVASFDDPAFQFPAFAAFNTPALPPAGSLRLPAQGGVIAGLNAYARWTLDTSQPQQALLRTLLGLDPSLGIALQVGANPATDSRLYVSYSTTLQGHPFACTFGGQIKDGQVGLFLTGRLQAAIQDQPLTFDVTLLFVAAGAFISGSVLGSVTFEGLTLSNLALVVGINWEGIPSLGVAATLAVDRFSSSVAVFFDSTNPSRSLLAGSVTDLTLQDVVDVFAGPAVPSEVDDVLARIKLVGTNAFTVGPEIGDALDDLQLGAVAAAFAAHGVTIPATASQVLVVAGEAGRWFLTDLATMHHYMLVRESDGIHVTLDPQLYVAPAPTTIGALRLPQGFFVNGALDVFGFHATATVDVAPSRGIAVDGAMDRLVVGTEALFSITSMDGATGPAVSIATFNRPELPDPDLRRPHVLIDGNLRMLGLRRGVRVSVGAGGFSFEIAGPLVPGITYDLRGHVGGPTDLSVGGTLTVGVIGLGTLDLGLLGSVSPSAGVEGALDLGVSGGAARAQVTGTFAFADTTLTLAPVSLAVDGDALLDALPDAVRDAVVAALKAFLTDAAQWARLVRDGVIIAVSGIGSAMKGVYGLTATGAAQAFQQAGYTADQVGDLLQSDWSA
ncbi:MAG TPA: hypothetical protein VK610_08850, partial [Rhodothermales bacterium]|nr:hypothetical protein [Rhodothermales bacterium]